MEHSYAKIKGRAKDFFLVTEKEFIYVVILTLFFTFLSFVGHMRTEPSPTYEIDGLFVSYYGFPLEWFKMRVHLSYSWFTTWFTKFEILWIGFVLDLALYVLLSLAIVHYVNKIAEQRSTTASERQLRSLTVTDQP